MNFYMFIIFCTLLISCGKGERDEANFDQNDMGPGEQSFYERPKFGFDHSFLSFENKLEKPKANDQKYSVFEVKRSSSKFDLNYQIYDKGLRNITLAGIELVLGGENSHPAYDQFKKTYDVETLRIHAKKLIILKPIHIAGGKVFISAQELVFKGEGRIITTPATRQERAPFKENGADGLPGGEIEIYAGHISGLPEGLSLVADGGKGQPAGPGMDGARGKNAKIVKGKDYYHWKYTVVQRGGRERGDRYYKKKKEGRRSENGKPAQVGGYPGLGGKGGDIKIVSKSIKNLKASFEGGSHGEKDMIRKGGAPGSPAVTCRLEYGKRKACAKAVQGADAHPKERPGNRGEKGNARYERQEFHLSPSVLFLMNEFGKDLYFSRYVDRAKKVFNELKENKNRDLFASPVGVSAIKEAHSRLAHIDMRLDYFGNEKTWVPGLSFTAAAKAFESEGRKALGLYLLTEELLNKNTLARDKRRAIKDLQRKLELETKESSKLITANVMKDAALRKSLSDLEVAEQEFRFELERVEKEIRSMAKKNLKVPFWKKTLGVVSALSKAIPAGQPSFGAVGIGVDVLLKSFSGKYQTSDFLNDVPGLARSFKGFNWAKAAGELDAKLQRFDPREFSNLGSNEAKLERLEELAAFAKPMSEEIKRQVGLWKERETSRSALDAEIQKIKMSHKVYRKLLEKLEKVLAKKADFYNLAKGLAHGALKELENIKGNFLVMAYAWDGIAPINNASLQLALKSLNNKAKRRLKFYSYTAIKAYEYQYLESFPLSGGLGEFFQRAGKLVEQEATFEQKLKRMNILFSNEVSSITQSVILNAKKRKSLVKYHELNSVLLERLNKGEEVYLDFTDLDFFGKEKENMRILNVKLDERSLFEGSDFEMIFEHVGEGMVKSGEEFYFFTHDQKTVWISSSQHGQLFHSSPSAQAGEALASALGLDRGTEVFALPSARTFIKTSLKGHSRLKEGFLRIEYDFEYGREFAK